MSRNNTELMGMSTVLVCKTSVTAINALAITTLTYAKQAGGQGQTWWYMVKRAAIDTCGPVIFDPRLTPFAYGCRTSPSASGTSAPLMPLLSALHTASPLQEPTLTGV